jgi:hypothetical protein
VAKGAVDLSRSWFVINLAEDLGRERDRNEKGSEQSSAFCFLLSAFCFLLSWVGWCACACDSVGPDRTWGLFLENESSAGVL